METRDMEDVIREGESVHGKAFTDALMDRVTELREANAALRAKLEACEEERDAARKMTRKVSLRCEATRKELLAANERVRELEGAGKQNCRECRASLGRHDREPDCAACPMTAALAQPTGDAPAILTGIGLIAQERQRQISQENWTSEHDDEHSPGTLELAAACYALHPNHRGSKSVPHHHEWSGNARYMDDSHLIPCGGQVEVPDLWPWDGCWWKPSSRVRDLMKSGALIAAAIDQELRKGSIAQPTGGGTDDSLA